MGFKLDYNKALILDAEDLAEGGIRHTYESVRHLISQHVSTPAQIQESLDSDRLSYSVKCGAEEYVIYSPELANNEGQSWGRAAHAFFKIINDQLAQSEYRLYAIGGGHDLSGMFLTQAECEAARKSLPRKEDWPYIPTLEHSWYGQPHR